MLTHLTIASHVETNQLKNECLSSVWIISRLEYDFLFVSPEGRRKLSGTWHSDLDQWAVICKLMILIRVEDLSLISCVVLCGMSWPGRQTGCVMQSPEASPHSLPPILPNSVQVSGSHQQQDAADRECCKIYFLLLRASPTNKPSIELGVQCWMS